MAVFYTLAYWLGFAPWENAATHAPAASRVMALFEREEQGHAAPHGRALDLGCGRGHWSIVLARRGWDVTGVDIVSKAIRAARRNASRAGVDVRFIQGDVTALGELGLDPGFRLVWDFGTLHGLTPAERSAAGHEVTALAAADATVLLLAWAPGRRGPLPRGLSRTELEAAFAGWRITDEEPFDVSGLPRSLRTVDPRVYRMRRRDASLGQRRSAT